jgi:hypothetical protein
VTGQRGDELLLGSERPSRVVPRWVTAGALALVAGAGAFAVFLDGGNPRAAAGPPPTPTTSPRRVLPSVDPLTLITSGNGVCTETDHRRTLTVSFGVVNLSSEAVVVRKVTPTLPLGSLWLIHQSIGVAACGEVQSNDGSRVLTPGRSLVVLFTFALRKECPVPYPVQAEVTVSGVDGARQVGVPIPVLNDLGGIDFDQC